MLSRFNFNDIDVITDIGTTGTISFENNDKIYFLPNNNNEDYNANIFK